MCCLGGYRLIGYSGGMAVYIRKMDIDEWACGGEEVADNERTLRTLRGKNNTKTNINKVYVFCF